MSIEKLQTKVGEYQARGWVKVSQQPFEKLCRLATATRECTSQDISPEERTIAAKLFALIGRQGRTSAATALFKSKHQVNALLDVPWSDIDWYAHHPLRSSISSMYANLGFPDRDAVEKLERWVELNAPDNSVGKLLSSITGMQNGRGVPEAEDLAKLKEWCVTNSSPETWTSLLSSITGMQHGCGVPKADDLAKLKERLQSG